MLQEISYYLILGKPFIMYLGLLTLASFLATASIGLMTLKGIGNIPFKWHPRMAGLSIGLAVFHRVLGVLLFF